ncbi:MULTISPECIES: MbcA/ParS/Xre antitoxin family protein [unclassified Marinobacter]|uniref:MbcA/ParS/Xre antitoxin family protein n=1 Tax=unclassified Marinobacter TaxID=83889 RepID=UPI0012694BFA|nr:MULTISPECIES: MbcA/ParS/Xre antitoxin family protein [unclassified Marinobacter]QFS88952.1 hypothetical protein FIV08_19085 [Marinobacter sp. THAF197a]QFT52737.1 hypothetical protein FIU96_18990 [Marinobacter sp. THAF39]
MRAKHLPLFTKLTVTFSSRAHEDRVKNPFYIAHKLLWSSWHNMDEFHKSLSEIAGYTDERFHAVAAQAYFDIVRELQLSIADAHTLIGSPERSVFDAWQRGEEGPRMTVDEMRTVSFLLRIHSALHTLFPDNEQAVAWVHSPNTHFGDKTPLDVMLVGRIEDVHQHLDAQGQ